MAAQLRERFLASSGLPPDAPLSAAFVSGPLRSCCPPERGAAADEETAAGAPLPPPAPRAAAGASHAFAAQWC